jgi:hypothetical protein
VLYQAELCPDTATWRGARLKAKDGALSSANGERQAMGRRRP